MHESEPSVESVRLSRLPVEPFDVSEPEPPRPPPVREGLPPGFRMRADAHYVDQLDSRMSSIPVRLIDAAALDSTHAHGESVSPAFIDSIRRFGVLQPLLVTARGDRYRVIAGRRRLAAALAAGLREVPCLVQHVDAEHAEQMALASNLPATRLRPATPAPAPDARDVTSELTNIVSALVSCAELLTSSSTLTQAVAADLVRAEAARALDALVAIRILRDEMPLSRAAVPVQALLDRVTSTAALERQIRGIALHVDAAPDALPAVLKADVRLLAGALTGLVAAAASLVESTSGGRTHGEPRLTPTVRVRAASAAGRMRLSVEQDVVEPPAAWLARPFEIAWPIREGAATLTRLQAARKVADAHGAELHIGTQDGGTVFSITLPIASPAA